MSDLYELPRLGFGPTRVARAPCRSHHRGLDASGPVMVVLV
jgi:hypothetical protein